jgi:glycosyltransferase involved in cell wall biosynthesis
VDRTVVIRNGIATEAHEPAPLDGDPPVVVSVGRLKEPKTFVTLAQALASLDPRSFRGVIVGDGPDRAAVQEAAGTAATLLGERDDVPALLRSSDVFVLSSASEGLPISVLEAMASGLPVVASSVGGVPELVGEAGVLVPPNDAGALATALAELLADPGRRRALGAAARQRVQDEFRLDDALAAHVDLYERLLARVP